MTSDRSSTSIILIDFENVQPRDIAPLRDRPYQIKVFFGANQTKTTIDLAAALQPLGASAEWIRISGTGPNALDFHIAYYIGRLSAENPTSVFYIVSKDKGFDPLIEHLQSKHITCRRLQTLSSIPAAPSTSRASVAGIIQKRVEQLLSPKVSKPRRRNRLEAQIKQHLGRDGTDANVAATLEALQDKGVRILSDGKVEWPAASAA